jgi:hypothetical protein
VNIIQAGAYYVWLRILAPSINPTNNYGTFAGFNGKLIKPGFANQTANQYEWIRNFNSISLAAGPNQLILSHGNEQVQIDKIIITNNPEPDSPFAIPAYVRALPLDKKNMMQQKQRLSIRTISGGNIEFTGNFGNRNSAQLSIVDIAGRTVWSHQTGGNRIVWESRAGNSAIGNGLYFVVYKPENNFGSEIKKFALIR